MDHQELARRLAATPMFSRLPTETLVAVLDRGRRGHARADDWLTDASGAPHEHLILLSGELEAHRAWIGDDGEPRSNRWRIALQPDGPGFALLGASSSGVRVQALTDAEYLAVDADQLEVLLGWHDVSHACLPASHAGVLQRVPIENAQRVFDRMVERPVTAGQTITTQGDPGDAYYILTAGDAEVWVQDPITDETRRVNLLGPGDGFGEESLLLDGSRTATVRMLSPGRLLELSKADFNELLKAPLVEEIEAARAHEMLRAGSARLIDCRYASEFEENRIPGADLVPLDRLRQRGVFSLDPGSTYIVYCRSGRRSRAATFLLCERGFRALSLAGGIRDWPYEVQGGSS